MSQRDDGDNGNGKKMQRWALAVSVAAFLFGGGGFLGFIHRDGMNEKRIDILEKEVERLRNDSMSRRELETNFEALRKQIQQATDKIDRWFVPSKG